MERINKLEEIILRPDAILGEIVERESNIILPGADESGTSIDYMKVICVGEKVDDIKPGDYILDMSQSSNIGVYGINGVSYGYVYRGNIRVAVKKENFNPEKKVEVNNKLES
jgi:hypothetical protein